MIFFFATMAFIVVGGIAVAALFIISVGHVIGICILSVVLRLRHKSAHFRKRLKAVANRRSEQLVICFVVPFLIMVFLWSTCSSFGKEYARP